MHGQGVVRIDANDDGGAYTVTQVFWDASCAGYVPAVGCGLVGASARELNNDDGGAAGDVVPFWTQAKVGGGFEVVVDVTRTFAAGAGDGVAASGVWWIDATQCNQKREDYLGDRDWRGRVCFCAVMEVDGTPAHGDDVPWGEHWYEPDFCGADWDEPGDDPDDDLFVGSHSGVSVYMQQGTGRLYVYSTTLTRVQVIFWIVASKRLHSDDPGVPHVTI
jgi:hypothetical protein